MTFANREHRPMPRPSDEESRNACRNCVYWLPRGEDEEGEPVGACRHNPPAGGNEFAKATWPITAESDWCGAYRRGVEPR
jgi:hypothetical protein